MNRPVLRSHVCVTQCLTVPVVAVILVPPRMVRSTKLHGSHLAVRARRSAELQRGI